MESLFHLIFVLIKIILLASIYSALILFLFIIVKKLKPNSWIEKIDTNRKKFWIKTAKIISILLFIWMHTYWGNHGLGDSARIPIGKGYAIENINWNEYAYLNKVKTSDGIDLEMTKFKVKDCVLIGNLDSWFHNFENQYFAFDLNTSKLVEFKNHKEYNEYVTKKDLPSVENLDEFTTNYREYWSGWKFWLLP